MLNFSTLCVVDALGLGICPLNGPQVTSGVHGGCLHFYDPTLLYPVAIFRNSFFGTHFPAVQYPELPALRLRNFGARGTGEPGGPHPVTMITHSPEDPWRAIDRIIRGRRCRMLLTI